MRIMTFNIQHGLDYLRGKKWVADGRKCAEPIDLSLMASIIRIQDPDIVGLNEVRGRGTDAGYTNQAEQIASMLGYHCYFAPAVIFRGGNPYGNAILSKEPIIAAQVVAIPNPEVRDEDAYYEPRCVLKARMNSGLTVLVSHFGLAKAEQRSAVATVLSIVRELQTPIILMGDFNMEPSDPILAPIFEVLSDTATLFSTPLKSFPSDTPNIKIDYILQRGLRTITADIPPVIASDHRPYIAELSAHD